jgi:hypothetical protein
MKQGGFDAAFLSRRISASVAYIPAGEAARIVDAVSALAAWKAPRSPAWAARDRLRRR